MRATWSLLVESSSVTRILTIIALLFATPAWAEANNIKNMFSMANAPPDLSRGDYCILTIVKFTL